MVKKMVVLSTLLVLACLAFGDFTFQFGWNTPGFFGPNPIVVQPSNPSPSGGIRLGIATTDNNGNGVLVTQVLQGYPAYGQIYPGDVIVSAQVIQGQVMVYNNYVSGPGFYGYPTSPSGTWIYSSSQLQSVILSAPWSSSLILWLYRYGNPMMLVIQLVNAYSPPIFMMVNP